MLTFVNRYSYILYPTLFVFLLLALGWVNSADSKLKTPKAHLRIYSLEIAWSKTRANEIKKLWAEKKVKEEKTLIDTAIKSIYRDYLLVPAYCMFLALIVLTLNGGVSLSHKTRIFLLFIFLAGVSDIVENIFMTAFLHGQDTPIFLFSLPASLKTILLLTVLAYIIWSIRDKFTYLSQLVKSIKLYLAGIGAVAAIYWIVIVLTPGQDVVMRLGEYPGAFAGALISAVLLTVYLWYSSRLVGYVKSVQPENPISAAFHEHLPRLIAFNGLVSIQAAIFALPTVGKFDEGWLWTFVILQNVIYFLWNDIITSKAHRLSYSVMVGFTAAVYLISVRSLVSGKTELHEIRLPWIAFALFVFQLGLVWMFITRRLLMEKKVTDPPSVSAILYKILPSDVPAGEARHFLAFNIFAVIGVTLYLFSFNNISLANTLGSLSVVLLSLGIIVGLVNIVIVVSMIKKINFFFYIFVLTVFMGRCWDPYDVRIKKTEQPGFLAKRPPLERYFRNWVDDKRNKINPADSIFPVYVVIADGGAARSGYWVSSVLSALQDSSIHSRSGMFSDHVLCLAGASGGSVGNAAFYALLKHNDRITDTTFLERSRKFFSQDLLAPVITHALGSDLIQHVFPLWWVDDRAAILEESMEDFSKGCLYNTFAMDYSRVVDTTGRLPILFINTTNVQEGAPGVVSSIDVGSFSKRIDVLDSVAKEGPEKDGDLLFSTAVVLGARFPYVSPGGGIGNDYYVDGGYFDNTGAGVAHEMMQKIDSMIRSNPQDTLMGKIRFRLLYISNSSEELTGSKAIHPVLNDLAAPLLTVLGTYSSQTEINNQRLITFMRNLRTQKNFFYNKNSDGYYKQINLYTQNDTIDYPMNWVISNYNLRRMDKRLDRVRATELRTILIRP